MKGSRLLLLGLALTMPLAPASAGIFFNRKPKTNPAEQVPQLVMTLRSDPNEAKRAAAADELRQYDPNLYPDVLPALVDAATRDPGVNVRVQAVQSLGRIRPVNPRAGWALEQAARDPSTRVQWQARSALLQYRMAGYRGTNMPEAEPLPRIKTEEPPLAPPVKEVFRQPASATPARAIRIVPVMPKPVPQAPQAPLVPVTPPPLERAPDAGQQPLPSGDGPELVLPE